MSTTQGPTLRARARGPLACFTRPELKVERFSYPVMTPSAARGLLEAVLWKPAIQWRVNRIHVLNEIKFTAFRRNEVNSKAPTPSARTVTHGGPAPAFFADQDRAQRNTVALADVDYVIEASFVLTDQARSGDNVNKFVEMFERRVAKGQHFHQPYFGCREFVAEVLPADNSPLAIAEDRHLGILLWDIAFAAKTNAAIFFNASLRQGVLEVPPDVESALATLRTGIGGAA
jgi:CRISPR-associated protein Cas5d